MEQGCRIYGEGHIQSRMEQNMVCQHTLKHHIAGNRDLFMSFMKTFGVETRTNEDNILFIRGVGEIKINLNGVRKSIPGYEIRFEENLELTTDFENDVKDETITCTSERNMLETKLVTSKEIMMMTDHSKTTSLAPRSSNSAVDWDGNGMMRQVEENVSNMVVNYPTKIHTNEDCITSLCYLENPTDFERQKGSLKLEFIGLGESSVYSRRRRLAKMVGSTSGRSADGSTNGNDEEAQDVDNP
ncbi:hypothetical protein L1987_58333 [Smallanthus sonchifolius]|uniref:Uncharacterized protein n=1 Tax=Smallanthus sonchifolius TaxID=185202 RepID=A0ACB9DFM3_9ASTR|nr:hypothetical protein L1987_58333 [Smallanthus sonchifolius]